MVAMQDENEGDGADDATASRHDAARRAPGAPKARHNSASARTKSEAKKKPRISGAKPCRTEGQRSMLRDGCTKGELFRERSDRSARRWQPRPKGEGRDSAGGSTPSPRDARA